MYRRFILPVVLALFMAAPLFAQEQPPAAPGDRGGDRGGNPGGDRGGRGNFDPAQMRERFTNMIKDQMSVSDDEWKVIQPKLEKVMTAQRDARGGGMGGMFSRRRDDTGGSQGNDPQRSAVQQAQQDLRTLLENKDAAADQIAAKLTALREARNKAREELASAQKDLKDVLNARQEAVLVMMGMLD